MITPRGLDGGEPRHVDEDQIVTALKEIADLLRWMAEHCPCHPATPEESNSVPKPKAHVMPGGERTPAPVPRLTRREEQVLDVLITGASNRVISRRLGIAERTVKNNLQAIYRKLGVSGRSEAIARTLGDQNSRPRRPRPPRSE
ncbi:LuxR C-terminal-related transcriptional regulator [Streptomyces sp. NPDC017991]|uniref:helix-turn-helix domain-containing protein n=1 Tax=Streptomyces sp. NPDC017991 TaxID=3365026 RepID=UPI00379EC169